MQEAAACCRRVLAAEPGLIQAHFLVGLAALEAEDRKTAFRAFQSVVRLDAAHAAAWAQLARLFMGNGEVNRADEALGKAAQADSQDPLVHDLLGSVYSLMGEHGLAREWFQRANRERPGHPAFMLTLANNHIYHGETATAIALLGDIIAQQPNTPQAHWALAGARRAEDRGHIEQMLSLGESMAQQGQPNPRAIAFYCYAIGKELEDLGEWEQAFESFDKGAKARRGTVAYDEAAEVALFEYLAEHYTRPWFEQLGPGFESEAPIFVLGQPRTGTTLIERIISSHSQVRSAGELQQFGLAIRRLSGHQGAERFSTDLFAAAKELSPAELGKMYMHTTRRMRGDAPRFVDKLPQNYLFIPLLLAALPGAKIVHLTREPMDACFAGFKQLFADAYLHSYEQGEMARHHARYCRLMALWRERFPGRFFDMSYEAAVADLEPNVRALLNYLELPWEPACLDFHRQEQAVSTASAVQVREPVHTRSVGRWRHYEAQLRPMQEALRREGIL